MVAKTSMCGASSALLLFLLPLAIVEFSDVSSSCKAVRLESDEKSCETEGTAQKAPTAGAQTLEDKKKELFEAGELPTDAERTKAVKNIFNAASEKQIGELAKARGPMGKTGLMVFIEETNADIVKNVIEKVSGGELQHLLRATRYDGHSVLHRPAWRCDEEMVNLVLDKADGKSLTALLTAYSDSMGEGNVVCQAASRWAFTKDDQEKQRCKSVIESLVIDAKHPECKKCFDTMLKDVNTYYNEPAKKIFHKVKDEVLTTLQEKKKEALFEAAEIANNKGAKKVEAIFEAALKGGLRWGKHTRALAEAKNSKGETGLMVAVRRTEANTVRRILKAFAWKREKLQRLLQVSYNDDTAVHLAARLCDEEKVDALLSSADEKGLEALLTAYSPPVVQEAATRWLNANNDIDTTMRDNCASTIKKLNVYAQKCNCDMTEAVKDPVKEQVKGVLKNFGIVSNSVPPS
eukprot:TRINITY_DN12652_c0_g1_i2.p1 TRINITY_DN12652_c0_g1~~TRINITY_DN12652_c0_g1_i2.p1  ORF type:complete len:486 (-),score=83.99 TRINITY_DN12652_c0_g1_i2:125-1513(-)